MLLPSALTCDTSTPKTRYQTSLFASPPLSPPTSSSSSTTITNIYSTCRALQSMLTPPTQFPSPPLAHASPPSSSSPFKLRLRTRKTVGITDQENLSSSGVRKKISKRAPPPPRGMNKRRRPIDEDEDEDCSEDSEIEDVRDSSNSSAMNFRPSTPKRARLAPEQLPLGLERSDFHSLHLQQLGGAQMQQGERGEVVESVEDEWSTEEDRILVELVLEKLKLSKEEWQDCARSLGKDRGSVGKRWKSLMAGGDVGLKRSSRRSKIHGTWR